MRKLATMTDDEMRKWWASLVVGRRYVLRYQPENWSSGGGSLNPTANLVGVGYQLVRGAAMKHTDLIRGELESKTLDALYIRERLGIFSVKCKSVTEVPLNSLYSISEPS